LLEGLRVAQRLEDGARQPVLEVDLGLEPIVEREMDPVSIDIPGLRHEWERLHRSILLEGFDPFEGFSVCCLLPVRLKLRSVRHRPLLDQSLCSSGAELASKDRSIEREGRVVTLMFGMGCGGLWSRKYMRITIPKKAEMMGTARCQPPLRTA
jgi:hypothetical protein